MNPDLVIDFVNSLDLSPYTEELGTPRDLVAWLAGRDLVAPGVGASQAELDEAIQVREALRVLMAAQNDLPGDVDAATAEIDAAARRAKLAVRFVDGQSRLEPEAAGVRGAIGRILAEVSAGMADGTWERIKACRAEDCRWAYLDTAKNRSRAWCSMRSCGNRAKVHAYRERQAKA